MSPVARRALVLLVVVMAAGPRAVSQTPPVAGQEQPENWADYLPPGEGKALVVKQCAACHDLRGTVQERLSRDGWEALVFDMIARGAPILIEEADQISDYLGAVLGPEAPPLTDVNVASPDDLQKLPGVTPALAEKIIARRSANGPFTSRDQVREILGVDEKAFERVRYYLRASGSAGAR